VVAAMGDEVTDVVQKAAVTKEFAVARVEAVQLGELVEEGLGEAGDLFGVDGAIAATLGELDDAAGARVGPCGAGAEVSTLVGDVVEDDSFPQSHIAVFETGQVEVLQEQIQQNGAGQDRIEALRVHAFDLGALVSLRAGEVVLEVLQLLAADAELSHGVDVFCAAAVGANDGDVLGCARGGDEAGEGALADAVEQGTQLAFEVATQGFQFADRRRVGLEIELGEACRTELDAEQNLRALSVTDNEFDASAADVDD